MDQWVSSKLGKEYIKAAYRYPAYLTYMQSTSCACTSFPMYIMRNAWLDETQAGIKIVRRNVNLRYPDDTTLMAESKEELKNFLMKVRVKKLA